MSAAAALNAISQSDAAKRYGAYGMTIESDLALPELEPSITPGPADLRIVLRPSSQIWSDLQTTDFRFSPEGHLLAWPRVGAFTITGGDLITIDPYPGVDDQLLRMPLLGPVLANILHDRGRLVLHASAVRVGGGCVILLGDKGAGKSTTAAALVAAGHQLMTDDVVALNLADADRILLEPGFPQMKLDLQLPAAAGVRDAFDLPSPAKGFPKALRRLTAGFSQEAAPPCRIYVLERGQDASSEPLGGEKALSALMRFSYMTRFGGRLQHPLQAAAHFRHCATTANSVEVRRLTAPTGVERLGELVQVVEDDVARVLRA